MASREEEKNSGLASFVRDLFARVFSGGASLDPKRCCAYNAFLGALLVGGVIALRLSGPPDPLGAPASVLIAVSGICLLGALVVPSAWPRRVSRLLAAQGALIVALAFGFSLACAVWALRSGTGSFGYLPGLIVVGTTYGATLWADFGPACGNPSPWRLAGFVAGILAELTVAVLVVIALLRR